MAFPNLFLALGAAASAQEEALLLRVGEPIERAFDETELSVSAPVLDVGYGSYMETTGPSFRLLVEELGPHLIDANSVAGGTHLVLRDDDGRVVAEGAWGAFGLSGEWR